MLRLLSLWVVILLPFLETAKSYPTQTAKIAAASAFFHLFDAPTFSHISEVAHVVAETFDIWLSENEEEDTHHNLEATLPLHGLGLLPPNFPFKTAIFVTSHHHRSKRKLFLLYHNWKVAC